MFKEILCGERVEDGTVVVVLVSIAFVSVDLIL